MARIRSIHPGIWTDEAFMSLTAYARLLYIGIWNEAFDDGVFEWKPLTLKARIFPVDPVDVAGLLVELVSAGLIARAESHPKQPGLVRNFQKFQRPKKPNSSGMLPNEWLGYVGGSEPVPNQSPTGGEKSPQMEDGGGNIPSEANASSGRNAPEEPPAAITDATVYRRGKEVLGRNSGGQITRLFEHCRRDWAATLSMIEQAAAKADPSEWIGGVLRRSHDAEMLRRGFARG